MVYSWIPHMALRTGYLGDITVAGDSKPQA